MYVIVCNKNNQPKDGTAPEVLDFFRDWFQPIHSLEVRRVGGERYSEIQGPHPTHQCVNIPPLPCACATKSIGEKCFTRVKEEEVTWKVVSKVKWISQHTTYMEESPPDPAPYW